MIRKENEDMEAFFQNMGAVDDEIFEFGFDKLPSVEVKESSED